ncbi:periplasmic solute binding family protein, partial [Vibrio parahaemolyticus V-223/04]
LMAWSRARANCKRLLRRSNDLALMCCFTS